LRTTRPVLKAKRADDPYWGYEDLGIFLLVLALLALGLRVLARLRVLPSAELSHPSDGLQIAVVLFLIGALYAVLKLRHRKPVLHPLGWVLPSTGYILASLVTGAVLALGVVLYQRVERPSFSLTPSVGLLVLSSLLGPILEESVFRGCLLPLIARASGNETAVILTAGLFALFHAPNDLVHWVSFTLTGVAYSWIRVASGTTTAAALTHAIYNLVLLSASF
jgi:membrane protease YdiL (CAAX protease family)